ncbi:hypothetical protein [Azospirillum sp. TSO22-1]|uniref:hypothetical protein n=1 Tax=Azospirillum sp. TSO22-1 TaxID=716789 RepID=UPI000D61B20F|nr:hypothetical protein [Azospirillum sp. TSO22-1]PWC53341.1 hypothetical protein TSO221_11095 [Azospirillum sp. TSO22-1]
MPQTRTVSIDAVDYFGLAAPVRLRETLSVTVTPRSFPPYLDDLQADWVSSVATPAFRILAERRGPGRSAAFCSIGTGTGLDALAAVEVLDARLVAVTDVHEDVVAAARDNILGNLRDAAAVRLLAGTGDLLSPLAPDAPRFDVIYENLPNVALDDAAQLENGITSSSYVPPRREAVPPAVRSALLTLHYVALEQAKGFLAPGGVVLSMLGARVPLRTFIDMAAHAGYQPSFLTYGWKVQAEAEDILRGHAEWQRRGLGPFHFYRVADLEHAFAGLTPAEAAPLAQVIEGHLAPHRLDAEAALAAHRSGARIGHTYAVLHSAVE